MTEDNLHTLVVSFSGGRTSAFMARALQIRYENKERELII